MSTMPDARYRRPARRVLNPMSLERRQAAPVHESRYRVAVDVYFVAERWPERRGRQT
jgi:hypothetical protein